jgi:hypothetical protein
MNTSKVCVHTLMKIFQILSGPFFQLHVLPFIFATVKKIEIFSVDFFEKAGG